MLDFNPRAPCGARQGGHHRSGVNGTISIHVPLAGHDRSASDDPCPARAISIHVPLAGHDERVPQGTLFFFYFNPRAPCGARRQPQNRLQTSIQISIHVPLAGHDPNPHPQSARARISIHVPLAGHDGPACAHHLLHSDFNPRAPCGARRCSLPVV